MPIERIISKNKRPATHLCNARRTKRDEYCRAVAGLGTQHKGVGRCKFHGGMSPMKPKRIYDEALTLKEREKIKDYLKDTTKLDNETAIAKLNFEDARKKYNDATAAIEDIEENEPEGEKRKKYITEFKEKQRDANRSMNIWFNKVMRAVEINHRMIKGVQHTLNITEVNAVLVQQTNIMSKECTGCRRFPRVVEGMRNVKLRGTGEIANYADKFGIKDEDVRAAIKNNKVSDIDFTDYKAEFDGEFE